MIRFLKAINSIKLKQLKYVGTLIKTSYLFMIFKKKLWNIIVKIQYLFWIFLKREKRIKKQGSEIYKLN
jgi:hypothetical protein